MFENFCMASGWTFTLLDNWLEMDLSLWECEAGLFDWLLNGNGHECGLNTYTFENDIYELHYSAHDRSGEHITNTCIPTLPEPDVTDTTHDSTEPKPATDAPVGLNTNTDVWF